MAKRIVYNFGKPIMAFRIEQDRPLRNTKIEFPFSQKVKLIRYPKRIIFQKLNNMVNSNSGDVSGKV